MASYTYATLEAGAEELGRLAFEVAKKQMSDTLQAGDGEGTNKMLAVMASSGSIPQMFGPFLSMPKPASFNPILQNLQNAISELTATQSGTQTDTDTPGLNAEGSPFSKIGSAADIVFLWDGDAARAFKENHLDPLPFQAARQLDAISVCRKLIEQEQSIWEQAQNNVADILNRAINTLEGMTKSCGKDEWTVVLAVVAALAGVASAGASLGITATLAVVSGASGIGSALLPDDPKEEVSYSASTPDVLISQVGEALNKLITRICDQERKVASIFTKAAGIVSANHANFVTTRPTLTGVNEANFADDEFMGSLKWEMNSNG